MTSAGTGEAPSEARGEHVPSAVAVMVITALRCGQDRAGPGGPRRREASGQAGGGRWEPPLGGGWAAQPPLFERWLMVQCPAGRGDEGELLGEGVCVGGGQRERERNLKPLMGP